jgi:formylglycine-generating enzyme required for sulfatase activity
VSRFELALLLALAPWASPAWAQELLMLGPGPEERTVQDCDVCPRLVTLPNGRLMSQGPVKRGEFSVFAAETGFTQPEWGCKWQWPHFKQDDSHPVVCVSYKNAEAYAGWLSNKTGQKYRLPTVDEVRYAAMAGQTGNYWWGQSVGKNRANCTGCRSTYDGVGTSPVGAFPKNPFHLTDAVGNVWIWTSDCVKGDCSQRLLVGGGWANPPADLRVTKTIWNGIEIPFNTYGIRVVRDTE